VGTYLYVYNTYALTNLAFCHDEDGRRVDVTHTRAQFYGYREKNLNFTFQTHSRPPRPCLCYNTRKRNVFNAKAHRDVFKFYASLPPNHGKSDI